MDYMRRFVIALAMGSLMLGPGTVAGAQPTPIPGVMPDPRIRAELAAIVPDSGDLPAGYEFVGETFLDPDLLASGDLDPASLSDEGFVAQYVSVYEHAETSTRIRSYVSAWKDADSAEKGFALVEDERVMTPDGVFEDSDASVGEEPRETTTGTYTLDDDTSVATADVTFRRGNLLAGIAVETTGGTNADPTMAAELAVRLDERVQAVQKGEAPTHTNLDLPSQVISLARAGQLIQAGFLGPVEIEGIYGVQGSVLDSVEASWVESVIIGDTEATAPVITIGVSTFSAPEDALATVNQAAEIFRPLANQEPVDDVRLDGVDGVKAYRYASAVSGADTRDSYRLVYSVGDSLTVIDVQGAPSAAIAEAAATQLASDQLACQASDACDAPQLPADIGGQ